MGYTYKVVITYLLRSFKERHVTVITASNQSDLFAQIEFECERWDIPFHNVLSYEIEEINS